MEVKMMDETLKLETEQTLPRDHDIACLIGRAWVPGNPDGPSPVWIDNEKVYDLAPYSPTISQLLEKEDLLIAMPDPGPQTILWLGRCLNLIPIPSFCRWPKFVSLDQQPDR